jgi:hypothetical protein
LQPLEILGGRSLSQVFIGSKHVMHHLEDDELKLKKQKTIIEYLLEEKKDFNEIYELKF